MKQNKNNLLMLATIFVVVASLSVVSAANPVLIVPTANTNYTTSFTFNATYTNVTDVTDPTDLNSTLYCNYSGTFTEMAWTSFACTVAECTATVAITSAMDDTGITCNLTLGNLTDVVHDAAGEAGIMFDSTDPVCSLVRKSKSIAWKDTQLITWSSSDAIELVSTTVYVDRPEDGSTLSYTDTSRELTLTSQNTKDIGDWTANITATDRVGLTCTETVTFKSYLGDGEIWEAGEPVAPVDKGKIFLFLIVAAVILWFVFGKKK